MTDDGAPSDARQTLLRALDSLDRAEAEMGENGDTYLVVCWAHDVGNSTMRGWNATNQPTFVTTGLLREVAAVIERERTIDPDEDD